MENAHTTPSPALSLTISQETLSQIEEKIHYWNRRMKEIQDSYPTSRETPAEEWECLENVYRHTQAYLLVKERLERQIVYQNEMSRYRIRIKPKDKRTSDDYGQFLLITINPDPSKMKTADDIRRFASECRAFFRSYVFDVAEYVFEQRGTRNGDYHGIHCHGIVRRTDTPSKIKKEIKRRFIVSGICGNEQHVNVKTIDPNELQQTRNYLSGVKQGRNETEGREKREKQANDVHFRKEYGLSALYTEGEGKLLVPLAASR